MTKQQLLALANIGLKNVEKENLKSLRNLSLALIEAIDDSSDDEIERICGEIAATFQDYTSNKPCSY